MKKELFKAFIETVPEIIGGGLLSGSKASHYIQKNYNVSINRYITHDGMKQLIY